MKTLLLNLLTFLIITFSNAQTVADFENFNIKNDTFLNGKDLSGGFKTGNVFLPNNFNSSFDSWIGWAISSTTDVSTPGYLNQYSSFAGKGFDNSNTYGVAYTFDEVKIILNEKARGQIVNRLYISNSTYTALSMQNGDAFAKKFGGPTGNDPDFYYVKIKGYRDGGLTQDSINVYLADYRSSNNAEDYILKDWKYVDLKPLGRIDSLSFTIHSSDVGTFGINTPTYFCIDNLVTSDGVLSTSEQEENQISLFPNPTNSKLTIENNDEPYYIFDINGKKLIESNKSELSVENLPNGTYFIKMKDNKMGQFIKCE